MNTKENIVGWRRMRQRGLHINILEAAALKYTLRALSDRRLDSWHPRIRVDNIDHGSRSQYLKGHDRKHAALP